MKADTALLYPMERGDLTEFITALQPKSVFIHHFDEWRQPLSGGIPTSNMRRAQRAQRDISGIDSNIKVVIPKFFESFGLQ